MLPVWRKFGLVFVAAMTFAACNRIEPVYNVDNEALPVSAQQNASLEQIGNTISKTAAGQGWTVENVAPGLMHVTLKWNDHSAQAGVDTATSCLNGGCKANTITSAADITYSQQSYSIQIDPSHNIDQSDEQTYRRYNRYIQKLQKAIDHNLAFAKHN